MIAVRLSAQCTDERVNKITPALFARYPSLESLAEADIAEVEEYVRSCGFYHNKARDIVLSCQMLLSRFVPARRSLLPDASRERPDIAEASAEMSSSPARASQYFGGSPGDGRSADASGRGQKNRKSAAW